MSQAAETLQSDLARFLGPAAAAEWRALLAHLEFQQGFGLFVLLLPAKAGAILCEQVLAQHFLAAGRDLARVRFSDAQQVKRLPEVLLERSDLPPAPAVWVDLLDPASRPSPDWQSACRQALGLLNQHRNRLAARLPVPVIFVGEDWLQPLFREAAPDLWSIRIAVERLGATSAAQPPPAGRTSVAPSAEALLSEAAADPDYALEQARKMPDHPQFREARASLLLRAASGFYRNHRFEVAAAAASEALTLLIGLVQQNRLRHEPALAEANHTLAAILGQLGRRAEALVPAQEAVDLRRAQARQNPDAFGPDLAMSLNNLAIRLSEVGRRAEALVPAQEAVDLYRALARQNPDAFGPALASSLNNLAIRLSEVGRRAESLVPAQEAVELYRALARQNPDAYSHNLATSLGALSQVLTGMERHGEAAAALAEGIGALQPQFARLPEAFAPLMTALIKEYLEASEAAKTQPDMAMLQPALELLAQRQSQSGPPPA